MESEQMGLVHNNLRVVVCALLYLDKYKLLSLSPPRRDSSFRENQAGDMTTPIGNGRMETPTAIDQQGNGMPNLPYKLIAAMSNSIHSISIKTFYQKISLGIQIKAYPR